VHQGTIQLCHSLDKSCDGLILHVNTEEMDFLNVGDALQRENNTGIQVISRAGAILRAVKDQNSGMSLGQIAERKSLPRSTVQRIVAALETERLLISSSNGGGIRLGPELLSRGVAARYNVVERCRPHLSATSTRVEQ